MTITEKIEQYFDKLIAEGKLSPGDRLPGYMELCRLFSIPYSSAQRAYKNLEHSGKIKIRNGIGSFLNGGDILDVEFRLTETSFNFAAMEQLLNTIARENELNLNIRIKGIEQGDFQTCFQEHKVVIFEKVPHWSQAGMMLDYSEFEDYREFLGQFDPMKESLSTMQLPFYMFTYQGVINTAVLRKVGFEQEISRFDTLPWWTDLVEKCRAHGVAPAMKLILPNLTWSMPYLVPLALLRLQDGCAPEALFKVPCFATKTGERVFRILDECDSYEDSTQNFFSQETALAFSVGSWGCVQYRKLGFPEDHFRVVPLMCGKRRVLRYGLYCLETFINSSITRNEKQRIWMLLKKLLSKRVLKEVCAMNGAIALRKDMNAGDYQWLNREDFYHFIPQKDDLLLHSETLRESLASSLSALYEAYICCSADEKQIRRRMDEKLSGSLANG